MEHFAADGSDSFVITGDIPAMWLRDSTNQVRLHKGIPLMGRQILPYIQFVNDDTKLDLLVQGVIRRQARSILLDSVRSAVRGGSPMQFANAFMYDASKLSPWAQDLRKPPLEKGVWEGKVGEQPNGRCLNWTSTSWTHCAPSLRCRRSTGSRHTRGALLLMRQGADSECCTV